MEGHIFNMSPTLREGILLFLAAVIARSHTIPRADLAFAVAFPAYLAFVNEKRFDGNRGGKSMELATFSFGSGFKPLLSSGRGPWFKRYVFTYALLGLLLPLPIVFCAPNPVAVAAAPHLFLLAVQFACEGLTANVRFANVLRLAVPIGFNSYRLGTLGVWFTSAWAATRAGSGMGSLWAWPALALVAANTLLWTYNLFVFLLLRMAPLYIREVQTPPEVAWRWELIPRLVSAEVEASDYADAVAELQGQATEADGGSGSIG